MRHDANYNKNLLRGRRSWVAWNWFNLDREYSDPTLCLDILYLKQFYDSLLNDYFDRSRTVVVTTHQVEEIHDVLTDVMFINRGCIVFGCNMEEFESRYLEVMVHPKQVAAAAQSCSNHSLLQWRRLTTGHRSFLGPISL